MNEERTRFLAEQPLTIELDDREFTLVHGSPRDPIWEYVVSERAALACFHHFDTYRCLLGHSHIPFVCRMEDLDGRRRARFSAPPDYDSPYDLGDQPLIINPGSVGQPRDGDPRASYAVYNSEANTLTHRRVAYDIPAVQRKMRSRGLPGFLADRLALGR